MKKLIFASLIIVCLSCTQSNHSVQNCFNYWEGVYVMNFRGKTDTLIRTKDFQTEIVDGKIEMTFNVKWTDSCSYTLTPTKNTIKKYPDMNPDDIVSVEILKTTDSSYTQRVKSSFRDEIITSEVYKAKSKVTEQ